MTDRRTKLTAFRAAPESVEDGVIRGCSIVTAGPALGHGVWLDNAFVEECFRQASALKQGLKVRFGHPSMCSEALGTNLGRFRNFRIVDNGDRLIADMHFIKSAYNTPHGDLASYVMQLAIDDPDAFGTSIVFEMGDVRLDEDDLDESGKPKEYATCKKLHACDFVDQPAANPNGLFAEASVAGKVSKFLDAHPEVVSALKSDVEIVEFIAEHGGNISEFLTKYEDNNMPKDNENEELNENVEAVELESAEDSAQESEDVSSDANSDNSEEICPEAPEVPALSVREYQSYIKRFGQVIADKALEDGLSEHECVALFSDEVVAEKAALAKENKDLKAKIEKLEKELSEVGNDVAEFVPAEEEGLSSLTGIDRVKAAFEKQNNKR